MKIYIDGHTCRYEVQALCMLFLFGERVTLLDGAPDELEERYICTTQAACGNERRLTARVRMGGPVFEETCALPADAKEHALERAFGRMLYRLLAGPTGLSPAWGILTGVRPVRLFAQRLEAGGDPLDVRQSFQQEMLVSPGKAALALETARVQRPLLARAAAPDTFALYVSIPFCPSRCKYCSFVSHSIAHARELVAPYLLLLREELRALGEKAARYRLRLQSVYFGGGTPTTLEPCELEELLRAVSESFELSGVEEYTVEAGRPDTITREKLEVLRRGGVSRVSINPQSLQDEVLRLAQRPHTGADIERCYALARTVGFRTVNMDLIAGLEGDTPAGFADSLARVMAMRPENVTVHALSVKRAADLRERAQEVLRAGDAGGMVEHARTLLGVFGYRPYYLYRQKNTVGNLENTGWSLPGHESVYNAAIMDECQTILAAGAGAVTKLVRAAGADGKREISRIFNFKYPYEYISRAAELARRREGIDRFFEQERRPAPLADPGA